MKLDRFDIPAILNGLRTAAALMIGNSVVVPILTNGKAAKLHFGGYCQLPVLHLC